MEQIITIALQMKFSAMSVLQTELEAYSKYCSRTKPPPDIQTQWPVLPHLLHLKIAVYTQRSIRCDQKFYILKHPVASRLT